MIRIKAAKQAAPTPKRNVMTLASTSSGSGIRPITLTRPRRRPGTQAVVLKSSTRNYNVAVPNRFPKSTNPTTSIRHYQEVKPFSTSSATYKIKPSRSAAQAVEGDVIYRKEGDKIVPVSTADQVESPVSGLFSRFEGLTEPSSTGLPPPRSDASSVDLSSLSLREMFPDDALFNQLVAKWENSVSVDSLKEEIERIVDILPLLEDDPVRVAAEKEVGNFCKKNAISLHDIGTMLLQFTRDGAPLAQALFKIGSDMGDYYCRYAYGVLLYRGARGVPSDPVKGRKVIEYLAKPPARSGFKANPYALATLAAIYARDDKNFTGARDLYLEAANKGLVEARIALGRMYLSGELERDPALARKYLEQVVKYDDKNAEAHFLLGSMDLDLAERSGKEELDQVKKRARQKSSFTHYQKAASKGLPEAQYNVGYAYMKGQGVTQNESLGLEYWKMSAQQGFGLAQLNLGMYYFQENLTSPTEDGGLKDVTDPSKRDLMQAQKWFTLASRRPGTLGEEGKRLRVRVDEAIRKGGGGRSKDDKSCTIM